MSQHVIYCKDKRNWKAKPVLYQICKNTQPRPNRIFIKEPHRDKWTVGFRSRDGLGYVFYSTLQRRYVFTGVIVGSCRVVTRSNLRGSSPFMRFRMPLSMRILQGHEVEDKVISDLEQVNPGYTIHHLAFSGELSHGTDIVISKKKSESNTPFDTVTDGICSIEVVGVCKRGKAKRPRLTFHGDKDFNVWRRELIENDVLPVLAWTYDNSFYYMILTDDAYFNGMHTNYGGEWHQQTGYIPVERLQPYVINADILFSAIEYHIKTLKIIKKIKDSKPRFMTGNLTLYTPGFKCANRIEYELAVDNVQKIGYEGVEI